VSTKRPSAWQAALMAMLAALLILAPGNYLAHEHFSGDHTARMPTQITTHHAPGWELSIGVTGTGR
jgi:hypothetical protein